MKLTQLVVYDRGEHLAERLRPLAEQHRWRLRELRQEEAVFTVLNEGAGVLVLRLGRDLGQEFRLLERVVWFHPETAVVVVTEGDSPGLTGLAWDLGAAFVLVSPLDETFADIVVGLMAEGP